MAENQYSDEDENDFVSDGFVYLRHSIWRLDTI